MSFVVINYSSRPCSVSVEVNEDEVGAERRSPPRPAGEAFNPSCYSAACVFLAKQKTRLSTTPVNPPRATFK